MPPTADSPAASVTLAAPAVSGKWVILGILGLALAAAGGSWWFRYRATHRVAEFWGPQATQLIRDAPTVLLRRLPDETNLAPQIRDRAARCDSLASAPVPIDISSARGLTHLRNALLDDRSYHWPEEAVGPNDRWRWAMTFRSENNAELALRLSPNLHAVTKDCPPGEFPRKLSCEPIARGLEEMFAEFAVNDGGPPASPSKPAAEAASPDAGVEK